MVKIKKISTFKVTLAKVKFLMGILEKIADIEREISRTQKNKGKYYF